MESCLYEGWVGHRRAGAVPHAFRFPLAMLYLDLDELDVVFRGRWGWSTRRPALAWVRRRDHLGAPEVPLAEAVRDLVEARLGVRPAGPIRLLTHPRYGGYVFNPLSLFYCFEPGGDRLTAVVADVTNTPWGERHQYVLAAEDPGGADPGGGPDRFARQAKAFHVSPFLPMALDYDWRIGRPGPSLDVRIAAHAHPPGQASAAAALAGTPGAPVFTATLALRRRAIGSTTLARVLVRFPLLTAQVVAAIYWQAFRLWRRGAPFHAHPPAAAVTPGGGR